MVMKLVKTYKGVQAAEITRSFDDGLELHDFLSTHGLHMDITDCIDDVMNRPSVVYTVPVSGPGYMCLTANDEKGV